MSATKFEFSVREVTQNRVDVTAFFDVSGVEETLDLTMAAWSAGSYKIRDYAKDVLSTAAFNENGESLEMFRTSETTWRVKLNGAKRLKMTYGVYAHDTDQINPRQSFISNDIAFFHFPTLLISPDVFRDEKVEVKISVPKTWPIYSGLGVEGVSYKGEAEFVADSIDALYDTPVFAGDLYAYRFEVDDLPHYLVLNESLVSLGYHESQLLEDLTEIVKGNRSYFDHYPYDHYYFFLIASRTNGGGLEHHNSSVNLFPRGHFVFPSESAPYTDTGYISLLSLFSHEHFHSWNAKEFAPEPLFRPDYTRPADTRDLWTIEGFAHYYEKRTLLIANRIDREVFLREIKEDICAYDNHPGHSLESLTDSGATAWIKYYNQGENYRNVSMSYYTKGGLAAMLLDIDMRLTTDGKYGLCDALKVMSNTYGGTKDLLKRCGYPFEAYKKVVSELTGKDYTPFFDQYIHGLQEMPFDEMFKKIGINVVRKEEFDSKLGLRFKANTTELVVSSVLDGSGMRQAGVFPGDLIVAFDRRQVTTANFERNVSGLEVCGPKVVPIHLFRNGRLVELEYEFTARDKKNLVKSLEIEEVSEDIAKIRDAWFCS